MRRRWSSGVSPTNSVMFSAIRRREACWTVMGGTRQVKRGARGSQLDCGQPRAAAPTRSLHYWELLRQGGVVEVGNIGVACEGIAFFSIHQNLHFVHARKVGGQCARHG